MSDFNFLQRRIEYLRENIRMRDVMQHFGHRYRLQGNMLCPFHPEQNPSSRLYDAQDTFWCWTCSPEKGVDIIEYVMLELGLQADVDPNSHMPADKRRALATLRAIDYLEEVFGSSYKLQPWEEKLEKALRTRSLVDRPQRYWRSAHIQVLRIMALVESNEKWRVYTSFMDQLSMMQDEPIYEQKLVWDQLRLELASLQLAAVGTS